jgi:hypothetical protein
MVCETLSSKANLGYRLIDRSSIYGDTVRAWGPKMENVEFSLHSFLPK